MQRQRRKNKQIVCGSSPKDPLQNLSQSNSIFNCCRGLSTCAGLLGKLRLPEMILAFWNGVSY
eukprot:5931558-Amphidinium_carterae.1